MKTINTGNSVNHLRTGFTTGACAAASSKAASILLAMDQGLFVSDNDKDLFQNQKVEITFPDKRRVRFSIKDPNLTTFHSQLISNVSIIKDAGDDPDVTDGIEITSSVKFNDDKTGIYIIGGEGVGIVTRPGLGLEIGSHAINPIPKQMIISAIKEISSLANIGKGIDVIISAIKGEEIAKRTLNPRLGIIGGISILGTTGIVYPYSTSAYKTCITQAIEIASAVGFSEIVFTTGRRSEKFAQSILNLQEVQFIQAGDFIGFALEEALRLGIKSIVICGMPGKLFKMASGELNTHFSASEWKKDILPERFSTAGTARHAYEMITEEGQEDLFNKICKSVAEICKKHTGNQIEIETILTNFEGKIIGRFL